MPAHGDGRLADVTIDDYSAELRDENGLIGDRASMRAFADILERERERARQRDGTDPLASAGGEPSKRELDRAVAEGSDAGDLVHEALDRFSHELVAVIAALLATPAWRGTQRIAVGGGMRGSRVGELAIERARTLLQARDAGIELTPIWHDPDEAGLLGAIRLPDPAALYPFDSLLAVDIGGSKMRIGCVVRDGPALAFSDIWRHGDDEPDREQAVEGLIDRLGRSIERAEKEGLRLSPVIGIGCPGRIRPDGAIERGGQNLPGNWDAPFNLPERLAAALPRISGEPAAPMMHNDAVVQGLSEASRMRDVRHWGVVTIGTGLGNARITNSA